MKNRYNFPNHRYNSRNSNRYNRSNRYTNNSQSDSTPTSNDNKINLESYKRWLYNIKQANENDFLNSSKRILQRATRRPKKNSRVRSIIDYYNLYMTNIVNLRLTIETLRQKAMEQERQLNDINSRASQLTQRQSELAQDLINQQKRATNYVHSPIRRSPHPASSCFKYCYYRLCSP